MVPIEAIACGCKVVISDLNGVKEFYDRYIRNASIEYVRLPKIENCDCTDNSELSDYEKRISDAIIDMLGKPYSLSADLTDISWDNLVKNLLLMEKVV